MKYLVFKTDDIKQALTENDLTLLNTLCRDIAKYRQSKGKGSNLYLVVNIDEPYAGKVADLIEAEERRKGTWDHGNKSMREVMGIK